MVFESVVTDVLNKILGDYIENLDKKQLKIGIWGGDVVLHSLKLRVNALDDLDLPVELVYGYLGKLVLKIPWKNLYSQPVVAEIQDFYLLVSPKEAVPFDAEKEAKNSLQVKQTALQALEDAHKKELDADRPKPDATFTEKLTAQIINNLQVTIANVHVRYEDTSTTGRPFAFGASLHNLELYTTDNNWQRCYLTEQVSRVFKIANLDCLSVYMNCISAKLFTQNDNNAYNELFRDHVAKKEFIPDQYAYIFGPISSVAKLKLNMTPEYDNPPFQIPKIDLSLAMDVLHIGLTSTQFQDILKLADNMNRMQLGAPYRKYRPFNIPYKNHYKEWWRFAISSVLEEQVRKCNREWTWQHMKEHRDLCHTYAEKYRELQLTAKPAATLVATVNLLEERLDLFNLVLIRKRIQLDVDKIKKEEEERKKTTAKAGWFGGWFGGGAKANDDDSITYAQRLEAAMTPEEKAKLYKAIGYTENTAPQNLPEVYEAIQANFKLSALEIGLYDDSQYSTEDTNIVRGTYNWQGLQNIMMLKFSMVTCDVKQRPAASALSATVGVKEMQLTGIENPNVTTPVVIKSQITEEVNLLDIFFETNPLDKKCDQRVRVRARPLQVVYHAATIVRLLELFTPPKTVNLSELEGAAAARMANFKERSATGMSYMIESHSSIEVDVEFMPNIIIVPYKGVYETENCSLIVLTLGRLKISSTPHGANATDVLRSSGLAHNVILESTMKMAYDRYQVSIVDMQVIVAKPNEPWEDVIKSAVESEMHVLRPTSIIVTADVCIIDDDPRLPKTKVEVVLPAIRINITEDRIFEALSVFTSLPMPKSEEPIAPPPLIKACSSTSSLRSVTSFLGNLDRRKKRKSKITEPLEVEIIQYTSLDVSFALKEFEVTLYNSCPAQKLDDRSPNTESTKFDTPVANSPTSPDVTEQFEDTTSHLVEIETIPATSPTQESIITQRLLKLKVLHVEASMRQKTYEMVADAKLGAINLKQYDIYKGVETEINVIDTPYFVEEEVDKKTDSKYLFTVGYLMAQKTSPEFTTKYNSTEQLINIKFSTLTILLHQECLQRLLAIADNLQRKLDEATKSLQVAAQQRDRFADAGGDGIISRLGTIAELATIGEENENEDDDEEIQDANIKYNELNVQKRSRRKHNHAVVESIKIHIEAKLERVGVELMCRKRKIANFEVQHFDAGVIMKSSYTEVNLQLKDIIVIDMNPASIHKSILSIVGKNAFNCQVVMYNLDETSDYNSDDMKIIVDIGCIKIVFLNWFVTSVLSFLNNFQAAQQALKDASAAAAETAKQNALNAYERASRMKLDVRIKAPIIIVPEHSKSRKAIALDLGSISLSNVITEIQVTNSPQSPAVIDELKLDLKEMKLMKVNILESDGDEGGEITITKSVDTVDQVYGITSEVNMFNPISMTLLVKRNLSSAWYREVPEMDVSGHLKTIELNLFKEDYALLMAIMNGNLNEGANEFPPAPATETCPNASPQPKVPLQTQVSVREVGEKEKEVVTKVKQSPVKAEKKPEKIYEQMKFNFQFDGIVANLLGEYDDLARFGLYFVAVKGTKLIDGTLSASIVLCNLQIDDMRQKSKNKITNYLCRKDWKITQRFAETTDREEIIDRCYTERNFMIDITAIIKENDTFAEVRISGFDLILSVDFLLQISSFITPPEEDVPQPEAAKSFPVSPKKQGTLSAAPSTVAQPVADKKINLTLHIDEPDIILVESVEDFNCNAIIFNMQAHLNYRAVGERQSINGQIESMKMYMCSFMPEKRESTKHYIIHPCVISLHGSTPDEKGLHVSLKFSDIIINISPATIELLNKAMQTFQAGNAGIAASQEVDRATFRDIWRPRTFEENELWFLRVDQGEDALAFLDTKAGGDGVEIVKSERCVLEIPSIMLVVESGMGYYTTPLISVDTCLNAVASDWSSNLSVKGSLTLSMNYYNLTLGVWEPIIELNERTLSNADKQFLPWELNFSLAIEKKQNEISEIEEQTTNIKIHSDENLEMTLSKTCVELLTDVSEAFSQAIDAKGLIKPEVIAPYVVENDTGFELSINFKRGMFTLHECHMPQSASNTINRSIVFRTETETNQVTPTQVKNCTVSPGGRAFLQTKDLIDVINEEDGEYNLFVKVGDIDKEIMLPVVKSDKRYFPLSRASNHDDWGIVSEVRSEFGTTKINIHGVVNVKNHFANTINIYRLNPKNNQSILIGEVEAGKTFHVPLHAIYADNKELHFALQGYQTSVQGFNWRDSPTDLEYTRQLQCDPIETYEPLYMTAIRTKTEIYYKNTNKFKLPGAFYTIHLKPPLYLRNALPISIVVSVAGCSVRENTTSITDVTKTLADSTQKEEVLDYGEKEVAPGNVLHLPTVKLASTKKESMSYLVVRLIQYLEKDWSCTTEISEEHENIEVWKFRSFDSAAEMDMDLYVLFENRTGSLQLTLYSPFWMINKTGLMLSYRTDNENVDVLYHPPEYTGPILFSFREKLFFDKKRAVIRVDNGEWSEKIPLDVAGSIGAVTCKGNEQSYQIGVHNHLTNNSLTKHITFIPFFIFSNKCDFVIELQELSRPGDPWIQITSNACVPIWPKNDSDHMIVARVHGQLTTPFKYSEAQCVLLQLLHNSYAGINVDVQATEGGVYILFTHYNHGDASGLIINHTSRAISFYEEFHTEKNHTVVQTGQCVLYTWAFPMGDRKIYFGKDKVETDLKRDDVGTLMLADKSKAYWVSFLDGLQRVLLFTTNENIVQKLETSSSLQSFTQMVEVRIHGIGLSVINNDTGIDILYLGIASSGIIWEERKKNKRRYKTMKIHDTAEVEARYQEYLLDRNVNESKEYFLDGKYKIDFELMSVDKPNSGCNIRRTFYPGVWLTMNSSPFQTQIHAKINRIQLDNQLYDCIFPVVLAPIPPPKSVATTVAVKPFVEASIVQRVVPNSTVKQYKYAKMLIQEFHFKVDLPFVTALVDMFVSHQTDEHAAKLFNDDIALIEQPLSDLVAVHSQQEQKNYYDNLHLGPIKIHVSFSMAGSDTSALPGLLSTLVQGVGVTLTDVNDVVFRLAFFEREYQFFTQRQLTSEVTAHYTGQALKQLYVLVLGLDVLGNPYGLVVGLKKGVEDLFYEPFHGAIQGPGEFAEGLCLGVKSLFGHTVGGAAGAVSKITGALGKGLAALTFDDEYQKKRRMAQMKKPKSFQEGIARSSKGLVMGFVDGVTGVVKKPVSGAKEEGVEGFFKGLGKGAIGLVARPTAGVVDFASGSLDAVKRATVSQEDVVRLRPPRFIYPDNVLRPYCRSEAEGNKLLREIEKGKFATTDSFVHCEEIIQQKEFVLVTNHRVIYLHKNELFASWNINWTYLWHEIGTIASTDRGVEIVLKKQNKKVFGMFSSHDTQRKIILVPERMRRDKLAEVMESQSKDEQK